MALAAGDGTLEARRARGAIPEQLQHSILSRCHLPLAAPAPASSCTPQHCPGTLSASPPCSQGCSRAPNPGRVTLPWGRRAGVGSVCRDSPTDTQLRNPSTFPDNIEQSGALGKVRSWGARRPSEHSPGPRHQRAGGTFIDAARLLSSSFLPFHGFVPEGGKSPLISCPLQPPQCGFSSLARRDGHFCFFSRHFSTHPLWPWWELSALR